MSRLFRALILLVFLASCGGGNGSAPRNLDDACAIARERPDFMRAFARTERRWGVPTHVQMAVIHQESKFRSDARTPRQYVLGVIPMGRQSSAYGYAQALDGTWDDYRRRAGRFGARRDNIRDATDFMGWYMNEARSRAGIPLWDARNQYLAYHEGITGYLRGSHRQKAWLMQIADRVDQRARMYQLQLASCRR
jgi:hypothetical protein